MTRVQHTLVLSLIAIMLTGYALLEHELRHGGFDLSENTQTLFLPDKQIAPALSLGFQHLWADMLLLQSQIFLHDNKDGKEAETARTFHDIIDLATTLDPEYRVAYLFAHFALSTYWDTLGVVYANEILKKGWRNLPNEWKFPMYLGLNFAMYGDSPRDVRKYIGATMHYKDAPKNLIWVAENALNREGLNNELQRTAMCAMCSDAKDKEQRKQLCERCKYYTYAMQLTKASQIHKKRFGHWPPNIATLISAKLVKKIPPDPLGGSWVVLENGNIVSSKVAENEIDVKRQ